MVGHNITFYLDEFTDLKLKALAFREGMTRNAYIVMLLRKHTRTITIDELNDVLDAYTSHVKTKKEGSG